MPSFRSIQSFHSYKFRRVPVLHGVDDDDEDGDDDDDVDDDDDDTDDPTS